MHVALYARVARVSQRPPHTVDRQLTDLREVARGEGWSLDEGHVYVDAGASGFSGDRSALHRLRDAAHDGLIDLVLVHRPDRLARRSADLVRLLEEFHRGGVAVRFVEEPPPERPDQQLLVQIQGVLAADERGGRRARLRRGRLFRARRGRSVGARRPVGSR